MKFDFSKEPGKVLKNQYCNNKPQALLSIITPYYNAGKYFEQTFRCVINQTFPWFEWIIVDDGSTDTASIELLEKLRVLDSRIIVLHKENGGISTARNEAVRRSSTELILPLDADDLIEETYVEGLYFGLLFNSDKDWAYTNSLGFDGQQYTWDYGFDAEKLKTYNFLNYTGLIRKSALLEVGLYDESERRFFEDWHMWLRLLAAGHYPVKETWYGFWYRRTDTGVLAGVRGDKEAKKRADRLIAEAAANLDSKKVEIKDFGKINEMEKFSSPSFVEWKLHRDECYNAASSKTSPKKHILMVIPWMTVGGADAFNLEFVRLLDRDKYSISIVTTKPDENIWRQRFSEYADEIYDLPSFLDIKDFSGFISYLIQSRKTELVFLSHSYCGYSLLPWLRMKFPELALCDYMHIEEKYWRSGGYARTAGIYKRILDKTYTCNAVTEKILTSNYGCEPESVRTIYIGVNEQEFTPVESADEKHRLRERLGIPSEKFVVLFPCRMSPQKRPLLMLEIAKQIHRINTGIIFVCVGDGDLLPQCRATAEQNKMKDYVQFAGAQEDMLPYYRASDMLLICSMKEGLALTAYEALSCGIPVVSSDVGGQGELIDETVGALVTFSSAESRDMEYTDDEVNAYVKEILSLAEEAKNNNSNLPCSEKGLAGRKRIEEQFSTGCMIKRLEEEFESLTDRGNTKMFEKRREQSDNLHKFPELVEESLTLYNEYSMFEENAYGYHASDTKGELIRIANSKWGKRAIKLAFKLRLNKIFK